MKLTQVLDIYYWNIYNLSKGSIFISKTFAASDYDKDIKRE